MIIDMKYDLFGIFLREKLGPVWIPPLSLDWSQVIVLSLTETALESHGGPTWPDPTHGGALW